MLEPNYPAWARAPKNQGWWPGPGCGYGGQMAGVSRRRFLARFDQAPVDPDAIARAAGVGWFCGGFPEGGPAAAAAAEPAADIGGGQ